MLTPLACTPEETVRLSPAPTTAVASAPAAPTRSATATPAPTTAAPTATATPVATPTTSPGATPNPACAALTGGSESGHVLLTAIRVAHNPGFDRLVFEFSPSDRPGGIYALPKYTIEVARSFIAPSGQPVTVLGNAYFKVLFAFGTTDAHTNDGKPTLASSDLRPTTPLIREVTIVEDFEATVQTAVGLDRLVCPSVLTLTNPVRVVLDFPTPP